MSESIQTAAPPAESQVVCKLCRRQFSKYSCPTCNVPYCSLTCFRSPSHSQCSETFYKKEIESNINAQPSKTQEERMKMMELLKRFEEENAGSFDLESDTEDHEQAELVKRFENVDLNSASVEEIWSKLTPEVRDRFIGMMNDPSGELAQRLLTSTDAESMKREPWWEAPLLDDEDEQPASTMQYGATPDVMKIPASMIKPIVSGRPLVYNMTAICISYSYVTRHLALSPLVSPISDSADIEESQRLFSQLVPFLVDRKATTVYQSISDVITGVWAQFNPKEISPRLFSVLLRDAAYLIQPRSMMTLPSESQDEAGGTDIDASTHPHVHSIRVLSDLSRLFGTTTSPDRKTKPNHVTQKLLFYAAHMYSTPPAVLDILSANLLEKSSSFELESESTRNAVTEAPPAEKRAIPKIEDISAPT